jgi:hypothetical protein
MTCARALREGMCGSASAMAIYHSSENGPDPMFDGSDWLVPAGKIDAAASQAAVAAVAPTPRSAIVAQHASDFASLQAILNQRCGPGCEPVTNGTTTISTKGGLAEIRGPLDTASTYADSWGQALALSQRDGRVPCQVEVRIPNARTTP